MKHEETPGMLIKQVQDAFGKKLNNSLRESGLTHVQIGVLSVLEHMEGKQLRLKELEKIFHVSQPTVVGVVDRLEEKGYIRTVRDPSDKRVRLAQITEEGTKKWRHEHDVVKKTDREMVRGLSEAEQKELMRMLRILRENLV